MKRLIIISAALMVVAMLYGAVDLIKADRSGELAKLYKEDEPQSKPMMFDLANRKTLVNETKAEIRPVVSKTEKPVVPPKITLLLYSRGSLKQSDIQELTANNNESKSLKRKDSLLRLKEKRVSDIKPIENKKTDLTDITMPGVEKQTKKKLSLDNFSRAPLKTVNDSVKFAANQFPEKKK